MSSGEISLYFGLKPGERADLEVIAAAAIEWVESIRAAAREIDPEAQIRVELIRADESSLRLKAILDWIEVQIGRIEEGSGQYPRLKRLAVALAIFVPTVGVPTYDFYFGEKAAFTEEDRQLLKKLVEQTSKNPGVEAKRQKFFRTIERDPSISSAGVSEGHTDPPIISVPSEQFAEYGGVWAILEEDEKTRTTYPVIDVTLIAPVLVTAPRSWTFQPPGLPEFGAVMRDKHFLAALEHDHVRERLRIGIPMTIRLEVKETKIGGAWAVKRGGRSVIEVISPKVE